MKQSRILIVEDETIVALDVKDRLAEMGYDVTGVAVRTRCGCTISKHSPSLP
ncbi:MAG: hypothetical protein V2B19_21020 [Pseudomonadota bacterium]